MVIPPMAEPANAPALTAPWQRRVPGREAKAGLQQHVEDQHDPAHRRDEHHQERQTGRVGPAGEDARLDQRRRAGGSWWTTTGSNRAPVSRAARDGLDVRRAVDGQLTRHGDRRDLLRPARRSSRPRAGVHRRGTVDGAGGGCLLGCSVAMACWLPQHTGIGGRRVMAPDGYLAVSAEAWLDMDHTPVARVSVAP